MGTNQVVSAGLLTAAEYLTGSAFYVVKTSFQRRSGIQRSFPEMMMLLHFLASFTPSASHLDHKVQGFNHSSHVYADEVLVGLRG